MLKKVLAWKLKAYVTLLCYGGNMPTNINAADTPVRQENPF